MNSLCLDKRPLMLAFFLSLVNSRSCDFIALMAFKIIVINSKNYSYKYCSEKFRNVTEYHGKRTLTPSPKHTTGMTESETTEIPQTGK